MCAFGVWLACSWYYDWCPTSPGCCKPTSTSQACPWRSRQWWSWWWWWCKAATDGHCFHKCTTLRGYGPVQSCARTIPRPSPHDNSGHSSLCSSSPECFRGATASSLDSSLLRHHRHGIGLSIFCCTGRPVSILHAAVVATRGLPASF